MKCASAWVGACAWAVPSGTCLCLGRTIQQVPFYRSSCGEAVSIPRYPVMLTGVHAAC